MSWQVTEYYFIFQDQLFANSRICLERWTFRYLFIFCKDLYIHLRKWKINSNEKRNCKSWVDSCPKVWFKNERYDEFNHILNERIWRQAQNAIFNIVGNLKKYLKKDHSESDGKRTKENVCFFESSETLLINNSKPPHFKFRASLNKGNIPNIEKLSETPEDHVKLSFLKTHTHKHVLTMCMFSWQHVSVECI